MAWNWGWLARPLWWPRRRREKGGYRPGEMVISFCAVFRNHEASSHSLGPTDSNGPKMNSHFNTTCRRSTLQADLQTMVVRVSRWRLYSRNKSRKYMYLVWLLLDRVCHRILQEQEFQGQKTTDACWTGIGWTESIHATSELPPKKPHHIARPAASKFAKDEEEI